MFTILSCNCLNYILSYFNIIIEFDNKYHRYNYLLRNNKYDRLKKNIISIEKIDDYSNLDEYDPISF
jgi:hypothetical protein